jgi:hypothetical protein
MKNNTASATNGGPEGRLLTIQIEKEFDVLEKRWDTRVYIKLYIAARTSGLLASISDRDWRTLTAIGTFMNEKGQCYPSQAALARALGVNRATANRRIQSLARFRFQGKPVLLVERQYKDTKTGRQFATNKYHIMPSSGMRIFDRNDKTA